MSNPVTRTEAVARITAHRAHLLAQAAATAELAATISGYGDHTAAAELLTEARALFAQAERFAPKVAA